MLLLGSSNLPEAESNIRRIKEKKQFKNVESSLFIMLLLLLILVFISKKDCKKFVAFIENN